MSSYMATEKIFVISECGVIRSSLCGRLVEDDSSVVAFDRYNSNGNKGLKKIVSWFVETKQVKDRYSTKYYV